MYADVHLVCRNQRAHGKGCPGSTASGFWEQSRRKAAPPPAPLPNYQRRYNLPRYPQQEQQRFRRDQPDRYQPRDDRTLPQDPHEY